MSLMHPDIPPGCSRYYYYDLCLNLTVTVRICWQSACQGVTKALILTINLRYVAVEIHFTRNSFAFAFRGNCKREWH